MNPRQIGAAVGALAIAGLAAYYLGTRGSPEQAAAPAATEDKAEATRPSAGAAPRQATARPGAAPQAAAPMPGAPAAAGPIDEPTMLVLDAEGNPTANGRPVDPSSELYRKLMPPGTRLPTKQDVGAAVAQLKPLADECLRSAPADKRVPGFMLPLRFRGKEIEPPGKDVPFQEPPAAKCMREKVSAGGAAADLLVLGDGGRWVWNVPQLFGEAPPRPAERMVVRKQK